MDLLPGRTAPFESFAAPARGRSALWRLALGAALAGGIWLAGAAMLLPFAARLPAAGGRTFLLLYLASFVGLFAGTLLAARLLQGRGLASLLGPGGFRASHFAAGVAVVAAVAAISAVPSLIMAPPLRQAPVASWAVWLPLALPAIFVQTASEELAFRGFLMQGLAGRFRARIVCWLMPAVLFGALHWSPTAYGSDALLAAVGTGVIGLVLGDITLRTGNLSAAIGLHFANNAVALLGLAIPSPLAALALWVMPVSPGAMRPLLVADIAVTLAAWGIWLAVRSRTGRGGGDCIREGRVLSSRTTDAEGAGPR